MENHHLVQATRRHSIRLLPYLFIAVTILLANPAAAQQKQGSEVIALPHRTKFPTARDQQQPVPGVDPTLLREVPVRKKSLGPALGKTSTVLALPRLVNQPRGYSPATDSIIRVKGVDPALLRIESRRNTTGFLRREAPKSTEFNTPKLAAQPEGLLPVTDPMLPVPGVDPAHLRTLKSPKVIPSTPPNSTEGMVHALRSTGAPNQKESLTYLNAIDPTLRTDGVSNNMTTQTSNRPPVAVPDVYTTKLGEPLVVAAPGHLANDTDPEGDPLTWVSFGLPAEGTITGTTTDGAFTYTPDPGFTGVDQFTIVISDGQGNFTDGLVIILAEQNLGPQAVPDVYTTPQGEPLVVSAPGHLANDTDPEGDPLAWVSFGFPANGTVTGATPGGAFTYTPDPGFAGTDSLVITITDGKGNFSKGLIHLFVEENYGPTAAPDLYSLQEGQPLTVSAPGHLANDTDPEGDPLAWISFGFPANGTVTGATPDGAFTYTPDPGFKGTDSIVITITDGQGNFSSGLVTISVQSAAQDELFAVPDAYATPAGQPLVVAAPGHLANDFDPEGDPISWLSFQLPANGTVSGATPDGAFTYTPGPGFSGTDSFVITITDGQGNFSSGLISILVEENLAPTAVPDVYTTPHGEPLVVSAPGHLANDTDPEGDPLAWVSFGFPANGTITGATPDGAFTYTPDAGFAGTDSFVITIVDGQGNFGTGLISILVEENLAPTAVPDVYTIPHGEPLVVSAPGHLANDTDPEGDPLAWVSFGFPANGSVTGATPDGAFTYTPDAGFAGTDSFVIAITDGQGNFSGGLVVILVQPNAPPIADAGGDLTVVAGLPVTLDGTGSFDPDGDPITYSWTLATDDASDPVPPGSNAVLAEANTVDPSFTADMSGVYSVRLIVNDGYEDSASDYVIVTALTIAEALDQLRATIDNFAVDGFLNKGQYKALTAKIDNALRLLERGQINGALGMLTGLRQQILDLSLINGVLTEEQGMALLAQVDAIVSAIMAQHDLKLNYATNGQETKEGMPEGEKSFPSLQEQKLTDGFILSSIYPNPFSSSADVVFHLSEAMTVRLAVYDALGREVSLLSNGFHEAGRYKVQLEAAGLAEGTYIVQLTTGNGYTVIKRVMLVR